MPDNGRPADAQSPPLQGNLSETQLNTLLLSISRLRESVEELRLETSRGQNEIQELRNRVQLEKVKNLPIIYENRLEPVLSFSNRVRNMVAFFKSAKCEHHLLNTILLDQLVAKMPSSKQYEWTKFAANVSPFPTVETFSLWVSEIAMVVSLMPTHVPNAQRFGPPSTPSGFRQNNANSNRQQLTPTAKRVLHNKETEVENSKTVCLQCQQNHKLSSCHQFTTMDIEGWTQSGRLHPDSVKIMPTVIANNPHQLQKEFCITRRQ
ncbi:uncharacterized protein [Eurosta solidaginis]|uniref:uncharacterized protein isoform X1 n=1 Tax=Eurosta solidaginis TaxID=178769 RepID=UPI0035316B27